MAVKAYKEMCTQSRPGNMSHRHTLFKPLWSNFNTDSKSLLETSYCRWQYMAVSVSPHSNSPELLTSFTRPSLVFSLDILYLKAENEHSLAPGFVSRFSLLIHLFLRHVGVSEDIVILVVDK